MPPSFVKRMIRAETSNFLNERCLIEVQGEALDAAFTPSPQWQTVAADEPCRVIKAGAQSSSVVRDVAGQTGLEEQYRLIVAHTVALDVGYRVTIGGVVYYVVSLEVALTDKAFQSAIIQQMAGADG